MKISVSMYRALCYADVFHFPLTPEEMKKYAIYHGKPASEEEIKKQVVCSRGYYCLKGRETCIKDRIKNLSYVREKMKFACTAAGIFSLMPTVLGVFVTGGLAVGNVKRDDDIDFMIVTKQNWLWTTRFVLVVMSKMLGKYTHKRMRREDATAADANTWCLNMWLDETALTVPPKQRNLYTAHEVIQALPLVNKERIAERFLWSNKWVGKEMKLEIRNTMNVLKNQDIGCVEKLLYRLQTRNMKEKQLLHSAMFHPKDTGKSIIGKYTKISF